MNKKHYACPAAELYRLGDEVLLTSGDFGNAKDETGKDLIDWGGNGQ